MANNIHELAQEAFDSGNYQLALELFGHILKFSSEKYSPSTKSLISIDTYIGYGDSLARCGHIRESFNVFAFICSKLGCPIPVHKLKHLTIGLLESVTSSITSSEVRHRKLSETQLPQKHLQHKQQQQQQSQQQPQQHQPQSLAPFMQNDSSECAKRVLYECCQQRTKHNSSPFVANKNHSDIDKHVESDNNVIVNRTQFMNDNHLLAQEYEKIDSKQSDDNQHQQQHLHNHHHHHHHHLRHHHHHHHHHLQQQQQQQQQKQNLCSDQMTNAKEDCNDHRWSDGVVVIEPNNANSAYTTDCSVYLDSRCSTMKSISSNAVNELDPLLCPMCAHVLVCPVTMNCGHTFCRDCVHNETQCQVCDKRFLVYGDANLKQDVLITRLVEKWWMPHIQAETINEKTQTLLRQNVLDEALKSCNEALEKCPKNYNGLLLRAEVLFRLGHFRSSLADAESAIKCRPSSYSAYYCRALTLSALGLTEDAIISYCLSVNLSRTLTAFTKTNRLEVAKLIQKFLMNCNLTTKSSPVHEYVNRCHLRTLKQCPKLYNNDKCISTDESLDYDDDDCLGNYNDSTEKLKANIQTKFRHAERENYFFPYKKSPKLLKSSKRFRRKHYNTENDEKLQEIAYLNKLADKVITSDSIIDGPIAVSNMEKCISKLLDQIQYEILKAKQTPTVMLDVLPSLIDLSDFDCVLCYRTLWKPVVTPCGHTYCMVCLDRCLDYSSCCPLCKTSLAEDYSINRNTNTIRSSSSSPNSGTNCSLASYASSKKNVTRFIEIAMQRFIPLAYRKRQLLEVENEPSVPVFICTTAYPNVPCPLYVYEPRHRLMIRRVIESGQRQFGIVQPHANGGYSDFGTILNIQDCVLLGNGCSILSTIGNKRFRVIERNEKDGYDIAKVEFICDEAISEDRLDVVKLINETIYKKAIDWYNSLPSHIHTEIHKSFGSMPRNEKDLESNTDGPSWAWYIIALLPLNQNLKVEILATTDLEKRLRAIDKTLEYVAAQQRRSVCVLSCEGLQTCQTVDCCMRATSSNQLSDSLHQSNATQNQVTDFLL